jgi:hypothetical protein
MESPMTDEPSAFKALANANLPDMKHRVGTPSCGAIINVCTGLIEHFLSQNGNHCAELRGRAKQNIAPPLG